MKITFVKPGYIEVKFISKGNRSPQEFGMSQDSRLLGIGLKSVRFLDPVELE